MPLAYDDQHQIADVTMGELRGIVSVLERCRTILGNMALENASGVFTRRWPINHEPLRADAKNLLPEIDDALKVFGRLAQ
jgi:hypothetical protein